MKWKMLRLGEKLESDDERSLESKETLKRDILLGLGDGDRVTTITKAARACQQQEIGVENYGSLS